MNYQEVCAKDLKKGDTIFSEDFIWVVNNHYNHDIQVRKIYDREDQSPCEYKIILGNCIVKKLIKEETR